MPRSKTSKTSSAILIREERKRVMEKLDTLQQLLRDATAHQALESQKLSVSFQTQSLSIGCNSGIETDDLPHLFAKLWLWGEPDEGFFTATHPAVVKMRQDGMLPRWKNWSGWDSVSNYQEPRAFDLDLSLFPQEKESRHLCQIYLASCDWNYELVTEAECNEAQAELHCYQQLGLIPTKPEQWTRIALVLAICRLTLSCLTWVGATEIGQFATKRCIRRRNWCDLSVNALRQAGFDQNPTVEALRVLLILMSTMLFETDCGLLMAQPQMRTLHRLAVDASERLKLHRDPPASLSPKERDDRRRMWWTLVTIDSYCSAAGKTSNGPLAGLQYSDTKFPEGKAIYIYAGNFAYRDLRSARIRFEIGRIHNRCSQLRTHRRKTSSNLWKLDRDLVELEASVVPEQRLISDLDLKNFSQWKSQPLDKRDHVLRYAQQTFYIFFWAMRAEIHRGLLNQEKSSSHINIDVHRDVVSRSSYCMLHLYRTTKLPTAYLASIASATLTILFELLYQPCQRYDLEKQTLVSDSLSRLQTEPSPVIDRASQVIEYFYGCILPHSEIPSNSAGQNESRTIEPSMGYVQDRPRVSDFVQESYPEASEAGNKTSVAQVSPGLPVGEIMQNHPFGIAAPRLTHNQKQSEYNHQSFEFNTKQPTAILTNHLPDVPITYEPSKPDQNADTTLDFAMKEVVDVLLSNHSTCMPSSSGILNTSQSDRLTSSNKPSRRYETHNGAISLSTIPRGCDPAAYPVSNPRTDYLESCFLSTSTPPLIELTSPVPEIIANNLPSSLNQGAYFQCNDTERSSGMYESYDPLMSGNSNSLWENLGIRHGSSESPSSNGSSDSAKSPASKILTSSYLHPGFIPPSTIINSDCGSENMKESEIPRMSSASCFQCIDPSSAKEVINFYQGAGEFLETRGLEQRILNRQGQSGDLVPFFGDIYEYLLNNSFTNIHNSGNIQLPNFTEQTQ